MESRLVSSFLTIAFSLTVLCDIKAPTNLIQNVGQDVVFMWNTTNDNNILSIEWGLLGSGGDVTPQFIYISTRIGPVLHNDLNKTAIRYKGRVSWVGNLSAGHAWFKITSLIIQDTNKYVAAIREQGNTEGDKFPSILTVAAIPTFPNFPNSPHYIIEGKDLVISCSAIGPPQPSVKWVTSDGTDIAGASWLHTAKLTIRNIQRNQSGVIYKCLASNNPNSDPVSAEIKVAVMYPPSFTSLPENKTVTQGKSISLTCAANGFLTPNITWSRIDGTKIRPGQISQNTLTVTDASRSDDGGYICTARIVFDIKHVDYRIIANAYVTVKYQPSIQHWLGDQIVNETDSLRLMCAADGNPSPTITWTKSPGSIIPPGNVYTISSVKRSDAGTYTCTAINGIGNDAKSMKVIVQYKPTIERALSTNNDSSWNGNTMTLKCIANGLPAPNITWYRPGGQQITSGVTNINIGSHVTITTTEESTDYGSYKCRAKNVAGNDVHLINVTQLFPPDSPNITMTEEDIEASSITVKWAKPGYDGGSPVIGYKVQINTKPPKEKNTSNTHITISGLTKNTKYEVKVFAGNVVGYGNSSIKNITTKKEGPPSSPDLELKINQTSRTLYWEKPDENGGEITKYTIYKRVILQGGEEHNWTFVHVTTISELKYKINIDSLQPGNTYSFIVTATNEHGESTKDKSKAKDIRIPKTTTPTATSTTTVIVPGKKGRKDGTESTSPIVIAGAVGAVVLFLIAAIIAVIILRKKNILQLGIRKRSRNDRASYHNDIDPDSVTHHAAVISLGNEAEGEIPTYAAVDMTKKKKKGAENDIPTYAAVDKSKKKRPGEIIYADLADFNAPGTSAAAEAPRPIAYTSTDYADISQFQKQDEPEPTYANFPGRNDNFSKVQRM